MELTLLMDDEAVTKALFDDRKIGRENVFDLPLYYPLLRAMWTWRVNSGKTRETGSFAAYLQRLNTTHPIENALAAEARYDEADVDDGVLSQEVYFKKYEKLVAQYFVIAFRRFWFDDGVDALAFELPSPVSVIISEKDGIVVKFGRSCVTRQKASSSLPENIFVVTRYRSNVLFGVVCESWKQHMDAARQLISRKTDVELISFAIWLQDMHRHLHVCVAVDHRGVVAPTAGTSAVLPTYAKTEALLRMANPSVPCLVPEGHPISFTVIHRTCTTRKHTRMLLCVGYAVEEGSSHSQKNNMMVVAVVRPSLPTKREDDLQRSAMAEEVRVLFFD